MPVMFPQEPAAEAVVATPRQQEQAMLVQKIAGRKFDPVAVPGNLKLPPISPQKGDLKRSMKSLTKSVSHLDLGALDQKEYDMLPEDYGGEWSRNRIRGGAVSTDPH